MNNYAAAQLHYEASGVILTQWLAVAQEVGSMSTAVHPLDTLFVQETRPNSGMVQFYKLNAHSPAGQDYLRPRPAGDLFGSEERDGQVIASMASAGDVFRSLNLTSEAMTSTRSNGRMLASLFNFNDLGDGNIVCTPRVDRWATAQHIDETVGGMVDPSQVFVEVAKPVSSAFVTRAFRLSDIWAIRAFGGEEWKGRILQQPAPIYIDYTIGNPDEPMTYQMIAKNAKIPQFLKPPIHQLHSARDRLMVESVYQREGTPA